MLARPSGCSGLDAQRPWPLAYLALGHELWTPGTATQHAAAGARAADTGPPAWNPGL